MKNTDSIYKFESSKKTREDLQSFYKEQKYEDIKVWIKPNVIVSQEACELEVLRCLMQFEIDKRNGNLHPVGDGIEDYL